MSERNDFNREYIEALVPDKMRLAMYVNQAKGLERTMAEFAEDCGMVSASTFSRIVNCKITKPLAVELIQSIVRNAVNPDKIDYEDFMRANGMLPKDEQEHRMKMDEDSRKESEDRKNAERAIRNIIADELYDRGLMLRFYPRLPLDEVPKSSYGLHQYSSFAVHLQGYEPLYWNFIVNFFGEDSKLDWSNENIITGHIRWLMDDCVHVFLKDVWEPDTLKDIKNTFVFTEEHLFNAFSDMVMKQKFNTHMSVVLVDMGKNKVVTEKILPRHDKKKIKSVFDLEVRNENDDYF
ncbi:MAG: hypothetical protein IJ661_07425 [Lachnospiraceae bacterium]|nr:hypothetical protein [Lachnospiraceae bacterium]